MPQNIRDVMTSNPCTIDADRSVAYAAKMMLEEDVGLAPIVEGGKLIGMLTDRDIATRVAADGRDPDQVKVRDVASTQLFTIGPRQDLDRLTVLERKSQVLHLPVRTDEHRLLGELRTDRPSRVQARCTLGKFEFRIVGQNDLHDRTG